jgi:hypothetical protein
MFTIVLPLRQTLANSALFAVNSAEPEQRAPVEYAGKLTVLQSGFEVFVVSAIHPLVPGVTGGIFQPVVVESW